MQWQKQSEKNKQYSTKHCSEDLEIDQHEPYKRPWWTQAIRKGRQFLLCQWYQSVASLTQNAHNLSRPLPPTNKIYNKNNKFITVKKKDMFDTITNTPLFTNKKGNTWSYQIGVTIIYEYSFGIQRTCTILWNSKLKFKCCAYKPVTDGQHEKTCLMWSPRRETKK